VLKIDQTKLVIVWKYLCTGHITKWAWFIWKCSTRHWQKTYSHVLPAAGTEMVRTQYRFCISCVTAH